ncbi:PREDICTED: neurofilament medium polypeptide-like, partial [Amphimedon queenslandica]|uniref:Uncharacterized protein n=2 Tax=Amphimedon queenslandica TaxID=400682 RepID=A0AAN0JVD8_AMPQE
MAGLLGGGGGGGQQQQGGGGQQQQGGGVAPAQQQQGGDALILLAQQQQPGANEQTNGQQGEEGQEGQEQQGQHEEGQEEQGEGAEVQGEGDQPQEEEIQTGPEEGGDQSGELQGEGGSQQRGEEQREPLEQGLEKQLEGGGIQEEEGVNDPVHNNEATPTVESCSNINTDVQKSMKYAGLVYYEEKGVEDLVTFTAAKKLDALIQFIERKHSQAEIGPDISFCFKFPYDHIELNFTAPQDEPITGWMVKPHTKPSRLYQEAVDKFGDKEHCRPSSCLISVYGSPDAVPFLNYSVPLVGVFEP